MSLINVNVAVLCYSDGPASNQPNIRLADIKWSLMGLQTDNFRNMPISLAPGEQLDIVSNVRTLPAAPSVVTVTQSGSKMTLTGARGSFRTARASASGDNTTAWSVSIDVSGLVTLAFHGGTAPDMSAVQLGDQVSLGTAFQIYNQGDFTVLTKTSTQVQFKNPLGQTEAGTAGQVSVYSNGPVQAGDVLDISGAPFAAPNQGTFQITRVTDSTIEVINQNGIAQASLSGAASVINVYPFAFKWMAMAVDGKVKVGLNGDAPGNLEVEPHVEGDIVRAPGLFIKRGKLFRLSILNPGIMPVSGFVILAE